MVYYYITLNFPSKQNETLNKSIVEVRAFEREDSKLPVTFELLVCFAIIY